MKRKNAEDAVPRGSIKRKRPRVNIPSPEPSDGEDNDFSTQTSVKDIASPLTPASLPPKPPSEQKTHHCPYSECPKSFNRPARLAEHIRSHTNERPYKCPEVDCEKDFLRETHLKHHVKSAHSSVRDYACDFTGCGKRFLTGTRLKRHQAVHEGRNKYRCTDYSPCQEVFRKHATLQRHVLSVHLGRKPYICGEGDDNNEECKEGFDTPAQLRRHRARLHEGLRYWCSECATTTTTMSPELTPATHDSDGDDDPLSKPFAFATYSELQSHLREIHPPTCIFCQQECVSRRQLRQHIACHHAEMNLASEEDMDMDKSLSRRSSTKLHRCSEPSCLKLFTRRHNLKIHQRTVHEGEKRFVCSPEMDLSSSRDIPQNWWECDRSKEDDEKRSPCNKAFQTKGNLEEHIRTQHLGLTSSERPSRHHHHQNPPQQNQGQYPRYSLESQDLQNDFFDDSAYTTQHDNAEGGVMDPGTGLFDSTIKTRPQQRTQKQKKKSSAPSIISQLTGTGDYNNPLLSGRYIECLLAPGCPLRFKRQWDLVVHLRVGHGVFVSSEDGLLDEDDGLLDDGDGVEDGNEPWNWDWEENRYPWMEEDEEGGLTSLATTLTP
ncbi:MAG: negative regulator of the PHO system [Watsoniomyces obsoletus]|nr:MAG: negative regulator of the PHO system [Watsoniomyces obsoletus]